MKTIKTVGGYRRAMLLGCTAIVALAPAFAQGQQVDASGTTQLQTITVEGNGKEDDSKTIVAKKNKSGGKIERDLIDTPASVSVITAKEMRDRGVETTEQALNYTAGAATKFYGSDERFDYVKLRGFDAYSYRDGLPAGRFFLGVREEMYAFDRVEVLKGGGSSTFGTSDPGGSVNYVTKRPKSEKFGEVYTTGGFGRAEGGFDFGDNITEDDTLSYRLTGKIKDGRGEQDFTRDDEKFIMGGLTWRPTDVTELSVVYDHLNVNGSPNSGGYPVGYDFDRSRFFGEPSFHYRDLDRDTVSVMLDHDFGSGISVNSNSRFSRTDSAYGYAYVANPPTGNLVDRDFISNENDQTHFITDNSVRYDATFGNVESNTVAGFVYGKLNASDSGYWNSVLSNIDFTNPVYTGAPGFAAPYGDNTVHQTTKALYVQQDLTFSDRLITTVSLRNDWIDSTYYKKVAPVSTTVTENSELTTRFGASYKITDEWAVYASYSESAAPTSIPSNDLERGKQKEIGVKYQPAGYDALFSAAVYDLTKTNMTRTNLQTMAVVLVPEVNVRGIDLEAKAELTNNISINAAYSFLDAEITATGKRPAMVPKHLASAFVSYLLEGNDQLGDMTFGLGARYTGSYYFGDGNTTKSKDAVVFDANFKYQIRENTAFSVNVTNLFDEKHIAFGGFGANYYSPARTITATLRQTW